MADVYERERQNNNRLDELAGKVSSLREVTINIYGHAQDHSLIDDSNDVFSNMSNSVRNTAGRLTRMAKNSSQIQILRLSAMIVGAVIFLWLVWGWIF